MTAVKDKLEFIDDPSVYEFFASSVWRIETIGPNTRIVFVVPRRAPGPLDFLQPVCTVILPTDQLPAFVELLTRAPGSVADDVPERAAMN